MTGRAAEPFWDKVQRSTDPANCWVWLRGCGGEGYGNVWWHGKMDLAHRVAYSLENGGELPEQRVLHTCDNPLCVNPAHLWLGTRGDNNADRDAKGRSRSGSQPGELNPRSTLAEPDVRMIRKAYANGAPQVELARLFEVSKSCICDIIHRRRWSHV